VPTEKRGVSMVFQSYAVWPHMSVAENVAYGLRVRKLTKMQIAEAVERALDLVQMRALADRSPGHYKAPEQSHSPSLVNLGAWAPSGCVTVRCAAPSSGARQSDVKRGAAVPVRRQRA